MRSIATVNTDTTPRNRLRPREVRRSQVVASDGTGLAVREIGPADAPLTFVFAHGYCLRMASWRPQLDRLETRWGSSVRLVAYDQRGHGASDTADPSTCTIDQLGRDLQSVIDAVAPAGPIITAGHSMGGMAIMAHAKQFPHMIGDRIVGTALVATAAEGLVRAGFLPGWNKPVIDAFRLAMTIAPGVANRSKGAALKVLSPVMRAAMFGLRPVQEATVDRSNEMIGSTELATVSAFIGSLEHHDETAAFPVLASIPVLVACGDTDIATPLRNSLQIARALPDVEMLQVPNAGHMLQMEHPDLVAAALVRLAHRATQPAAAA
jgi:pimeloyl-ACP methyl ester carboxylesterase